MKEKQIFYPSNKSFWDEENSRFNQDKEYSSIMSLFKVVDSDTDARSLDVEDIVAITGRDSEAVRNTLAVLVLKNFLTMSTLENV